MFVNISFFFSDFNCNLCCVIALESFLLSHIGLGLGNDMKSRVFSLRDWDIDFVVYSFSICCHHMI